MSKYRQEQPVKSEKGYADISPSGRVGLLDVVFSRIIYGFGAMIIVGLPFSIWFFYLGKNPLGLLLWVINYLFSLLLVRRLYRHFCQAREALDPELLLQRWTPRINALALYYGSTMLVPALLTGGQANFEFQLVYLGTVAAIVAGNSVQSSPVLSVFRCFFMMSWGGLILLVPYTFPDHWYFVFPLCLIYVMTMLKHSSISHHFFVQNTLLQEEGIRLAENYREAKETAEKALYDKNLFLTTASHDLRQPVHAMGFLVESIATRNHDPALQGALADLRQSVHSATQMFNALLDLSRIESGRVQIKTEAISLNEMLGNVATIFREEARNRSLDLRLHLPKAAAFAVADAMLLRQSLSNLVHNALRYTREGGILLAVRQRGGRWRCEVWDTGIGIASGAENEVFSPFFRQDHAWKIDSAGHGLGLAVVARCCSLMGAEYGFRSREQHGSCFWIEMAAARQKPEAGIDLSPRQGAVITPSHWQGCCLVIDDDPLVRSAWETLMASWGLQVACVESGGQAFGLLASGFKPDAVFCDQRLRSGESGFELLRALLERLPEAAGAMISGELDSPELLVAEEQGYLVLRKPVDPAALQLVLSHWLSAD